jgi:hypothetical protein
MRIKADSMKWRTATAAVESSMIQLLTDVKKWLMRTELELLEWP